MGGKGASGGQYGPTSAEGSAYLAANPDVAADPYFSQNPYEHYTRHGQAEGRPLQPHQPDPMAMFMEMMHEAPEPHEPGVDPNAPTYEEQMAEQQRIQGEGERDDYFGRYMSLANTAAEYVTSEIQQERANAQLLGIDYKMNDEMKSQRVNDYFATLWGEGDQAQMDALFSEWGNPEGFEDFAVTRGDASSYASKPGKEKTIATSKGMTPTLVTEDDDTLGAPKNVLGA